MRYQLYFHNTYNTLFDIYILRILLVIEAILFHASNYFKLFERSERNDENNPVHLYGYCSTAVLSDCTYSIVMTWVNLPR